MSDSQPASTESDWEQYRKLAPAAVPWRAEQIATLVTLLPFGAFDDVKMVDLGAGEGFLSLALLEVLPNASLIALDGSEAMLEHAARRFGRHASRSRSEFFELASDEWFPLLDDADAVVSSLCLHHLDGAGKQTLFGAVSDRLSSGGAFLIADLVAPGGAPAQRLFADTWDDSARRQSMDVAGSSALFDLFLETEWNHYRYPDEMDKPSPLFDQLRWLEAAGFTGVDCFWMQSGHAIYGGYAGPDGRAGAGVSYETALGAAEAALRT